MKRVIKKSVGSDLVTLDQAFYEFIMEKEAMNLSASTIKNYKQSYEFFYRFHDLDQETTTDQIKQSLFFEWAGNMKVEGIKPASINHYLRDCRTFFYWCMDPDRRYIDPPFKIRMVEGQEEALKLFDEDEMALLLEKPKKNDSFVTWRTWAIVNWILGTGNRVSTVCDVQIKDINFNKREIILSHTKNKKAQIIPLSSSLETVIKEYMRIWRQNTYDDYYLFPNVGEQKLTTNALRLAFVKYCGDRGVSHHNPHGLRHSFAKGWIQNNGSIFALQNILGHSSIDMTRHYVKLFSEDIKEDYDRFNPLDVMKKSSKRKQTIKRG